MIRYGVAYKLKKAGFILSFVILPTITFLVFYVYVNLDAFVMSFQQNIDGVKIWTLNNFKDVFANLFPPFPCVPEAHASICNKYSKLISVMLCCFLENT